LLGLELTEGVILEPDEHTVARLEELKDLGVRLAVDDFGTGYSALSYLRQLPVEVLKIDRTFVTGIADDATARTVAEAIIRLGEAFSLIVVAEGVETAEQARTLSELGCGYAQGYYFQRPADAASTAAHLAEQGQTSAQP
jgi:diguanylate cyclase